MSQDKVDSNFSVSLWNIAYIICGAYNAWRLAFSSFLCIFPQHWLVKVIWSLYQTTLWHNFFFLLNIQSIQTVRKSSFFPSLLKFPMYHRQMMPEILNHLNFTLLLCIHLPYCSIFKNLLCFKVVNITKILNSKRK